MTTTIRSTHVDIWIEHTGDGPDVLLIAGLGEPIEAWQLQPHGLADQAVPGSPEAFNRRVDAFWRQVDAPLHQRVGATATR